MELAALGVPVVRVGLGLHGEVELVGLLQRPVGEVDEVPGAVGEEVVDVLVEADVGVAVDDGEAVLNREDRQKIFGRCGLGLEVLYLGTYLGIPVLVVDDGAAGHEPEDQLLVLLVPLAAEHLGLQLDAELDVLPVPEALPAFLLLRDPGLGQLEVVLEALTCVELMLLEATLTMVALASRVTPLQVVDALVLGLVLIDPDLLGVEKKVDVEALLVDQFLLRILVTFFFGFHGI